jgi:hypothetical protein
MRPLLAGIVLLALFVACGDPPNVGAPCAITPPPSTATQAVIQVPSLECDSRMCLREAGAKEAICTDECDVDEDCRGSDATPCATGFACVTPFSTGAFAYRKLCICRDPSR